MKTYFMDYEMSMACRSLYMIVIKNKIFVRIFNHKIQFFDINKGAWYNLYWCKNICIK
jgi:hypothetical protein